MICEIKNGNLKHGANKKKLLEMDTELKKKLNLHFLLVGKVFVGFHGKSIGFGTFNITKQVTWSTNAINFFPYFHFFRNILSTLLSFLLCPY